MEELKKVELGNQELILEERKNSFYDYMTLKNLLLLLLFLSFIGGGFWLYNSCVFDMFNINSLASELNTNTKELAKLLTDNQSFSQIKIIEALKVLNENSAKLSEEQLKMLNELLNYTRVIKSVVDPNPQGRQTIDSILQSKNGGLVWDN